VVGPTTTAAAAATTTAAAATTTTAATTPVADTTTDTTDNSEYYEGDGTDSTGDLGLSQAPTITGSAGVETVVSRAMSQLGVTYAWGGGDANGPTLGIRDGGVADSYGDYKKVGFDCSGLMVYAFAGVGISLPHYSGYQYTAGKQVPIAQVARGDMIFWGGGGSQHVALYLGEGKMIEAMESGTVIHITDVRYGGIQPYAVRLIE
jgi:cell wall-associated NlpC family hydrolase